MPTDYEERARREREAGRARRREFQEMDLNLRMANERKVRLLLDDVFPAGAPDGLLERVCRIQNLLIRDIVAGARSGRELHDGINRIKNEADQRWVDGFDECARQVRQFGEESGLGEAVIDGLLRNHVGTQDRQRERAEQDRAATRQVEWKRG